MSAVYSTFGASTLRCIRIASSPFLILSCVLGIGIGISANDWAAAITVPVLWLVYRALPSVEGPPTIGAALSVQWLQVSCGVIYLAFTGRRVATMDSCDYQSMMLVGLVTILVLTLGLRYGWGSPRRGADFGYRATLLPVTDKTLFVTNVVLASSASILVYIGGQFPTFLQIVRALGSVHLLLVFLLFRRLLRPVPRWGLILLLICFEVCVGLTGYFSGFKEPLAILAVCMIEVFDYRRTVHWGGLAFVGLCLACTALLWTGIKSDVRASWDPSSSTVQRLENVAEYAADWVWKADSDRWETADAVVQRLWVIEFPALALSRVPAEVPHTDGALLSEVVLHVLRPRIFFPDKPGKPSDSQKVRDYSGVMVAGGEDGNDTSIAFGYAAESYVDFGIPLMFVPVFLYGALYGRIFRWLFRAFRHKELLIGTVGVLAWLSLYQFERGWFMILGFGLTLVFAVGGAGLFVDRMFPMPPNPRRRQRVSPEPALF